MRIAPGFIAYENTTTVPSLVRSAHGKILELGPGPGNQIHRYDASVVDFIYAVEPSVNYRDAITTKLKNTGLQDKYELLTCGVEDSDILRENGIVEDSLDTVISIQVLCAVRDAASVMRGIWKLLTPGGTFVFWEHTANKDAKTAMVQGTSALANFVDLIWQLRVRTNVKTACLDPAWSTMVGCSLTRDILSDILAAGEWENPGDIKVEDEPYSILPRISGVLIKKKS